MNNGKICVSVCAETADEFLEKMELAAKVADVIELRFDCLKQNELSSALQSVSQKNLQKLLLATYRPKDQGGKSELESSDFHKREAFFHDSQKTNRFELVDSEFDFPIGKAYFKDSLQIISFHEFVKTPDNLEEIYQEISVKNPDVIKIAVQANDAIDGLTVIKLLEKAKSQNKQLIPIAMSEYGLWTRILGMSRGAFMTFAALDEHSATAPGQLTAKEMLEVYRVKELDENTDIYGLVASSTAHSVSPHMHNAAFKFHNLNAVYVPFAVQNLAEFMRRMVHSATREIDWKLRGFSVTIPHKVDIIKHLDFIDETAAKIGAVNTVWLDENGKLRGYNTDAAGFIEPLKNSYGNLQNSKVAVLGAGGAARAVMYALRRENANVTVFARDIEKAKILQDDFDVEVRETKFAIHNSRFTNFDIVVNATPLGMKKGGLENETPATAEQLEGVKLVYDLVYNPFQTKLMQEADKVFVPTIGGLAMLVGQALEQQKIWTSLEAPMREISQAALRKLNQS